MAMSLNALEIYLTKGRKIIVQRNSKQQSTQAAVATFNRDHEGTLTLFDADRIMSEFMANGTDQSKVQGNVVYRTET
jgi:hypothetical protein